VPGAGRLEVIDPTGFPGWDELVGRHPEATVFHTSAWARVLSATYDYKPLYFTEMEEGKLGALLPFMEIRSWLTGSRGVSLPFTDEVAPILSEGVDFEETIRPVIGMAESRGWKTLEFRGCAHGMADQPPAAEYLTHDLDLTPGEEALFARYRTNVQRNIRKAEREGIAVESDNTPEGVRDFYRLNCLTRREHGLPPQPARFFDNLREHVLDKGLGSLLMARHRGAPVAGAVFLHFGKRAIYKYGASDRRYQNLRVNNLVFREGIRAMCGKGFRTLSFGRTDLHHEGLRQFKLSWGVQESRLRYFRYDMKSRTWLSRQKDRISSWNGVISKMPLPILRLVGSVAYRHVG